MPLQLKPQYVAAIKTDLKLQAAIAERTGKNIQTPLRWANCLKQEKLTMLGTLQAIAAHNGIKNYLDLVADTAINTAA